VEDVVCLRRGCDVSFRTPYAVQKYCSQRCRSAAYRARKGVNVFSASRTCRNRACAKTFKPPYGWQFHCSALCRRRAAARRYKRKVRVLGTYSGRRCVRPECTVVFTAAYKTKVWCSRRCWDKVRRARAIERREAAKMTVILTAFSKASLTEGMSSEL
jgi:hypothetical protein